MAEATRTRPDPGETREQRDRRTDADRATSDLRADATARERRDKERYAEGHRIGKGARARDIPRLLRSADDGPHGEGIREGIRANPSAPANRAKKAVKKAGTRASRAVKKGATGTAWNIGGSVLTFVGTGLGLVLLYVLLTTSSLSGLLGFVKSAVNWLVSPTAGIWHS